MNPKTRDSLILIAVTIACGVLVFDRLLTGLSTHLPGTALAGADLLLSLWWPAYSHHVADTLVIHSYIGAPDLANHLLRMPIAQSGFFSLLRSLSNPLLAANLTLIASLTLTVTLTALYIQRQGIPMSAAALAGAALVLSPWYVKAIESGDIIATSLWVLPLTLWMLDRWLKQPTPLNGALVIAAVYGGVLCGVQAGMWLIVVWLPYAACRLWRMRGDEQERARIDQLTVMVLGLLGLLMIYPTPPLMRTLLGVEPAYGPRWQANDRSLFGVITSTSLPIMGAAAVTLLIARQKREHLAWLVLGGFSLLIGATALPDPLMMLLSALQIDSAPLALPPLYLGGAAFTLLVYIAETWRDQPAIKTIRWSWLTAAGCAVIVLGASPSTYRAMTQHRVEVPAFYTEIAGEPEDYVVLEYPFGLAGILDGETIGSTPYLAQYAVWHHKRTAGGVVQVLPSDRQANVGADGFLLPLDSDTDLTTPATALAHAVNRWRIGYVVVRPDLLDENKAADIEALLDASGALCPPTSQDRGILLYRARWQPIGCEGES